MELIEIPSAITVNTIKIIMQFIMYTHKYNVIYMYSQYLLLGLLSHSQHVRLGLKSHAGTPRSPSREERKRKRFIDRVDSS